MKHYDYLVVGAGLFGATFAYEAKKRGKEVIVINNGIDTNTFKPTDGDFRKKYK